MPVTCIHEVNSFGGMESTHGPLCAYQCGEAAIKHVRIGGWCANICESSVCTKRAAGGTFTEGLRGYSTEENNGQDKNEAL